MPLNYYDLHNFLFAQDSGSVKAPIYSAAGLAKIVKVPSVNPDNPQAGIHLQSFLSYGGCLTQFALYVKNTFGTDDQPKSVKVCLKILFSPKTATGYGTFKDRAVTLGLELSISEIIPLLKVINGQKEQYSFHLARPGLQPKNFSISKQLDRRYPFYIRASSGHKEFSTGLSVEDAYRASDMGLDVIRIMNPWTADPLQQVLQFDSYTELQSNFHSTEACPAPSQTKQDDAPDKPVSDGQKKALWAVYYNKWGEKDRTVIDKIIETHSYDEVDRIIKSANSGDLRYLDMMV